MTTKLTKATQESSVGQGIAIGLLALQVTGVSSNKQYIESAFIRAWRGWPSASVFPAVHADLARNDLLRILRKSSGRVSRLAAWECGRWLEPYLESDWTVEEVADLLEDQTGVTLDDWLTLCRALLASVGDERIARRLTPDVQNPPAVRVR